MKLKRLRVPEFWKVEKKVKRWAVSPRPGPHKKFECIPLQILVRDVLKLVETGKEAKTIIHRSEVLVDSKIRKDHAYPVGLFDVISIPKLNQFYRVVPTSYGLGLLKISENESGLKICKIVGKTTVKKNKMQLNLHDGKNILAEKNSYKTGDSLLIELPNLKIVQHIPLEKGCVGIVAKGKNSGKIGEVKKIIEGKFKSPIRIVCKFDGVETEILKEQIFAVGKEKPVIVVS